MDSTGIMYLAFCGMVVLLALSSLQAFGTGLYTYIVLAILFLTLGVLMLLNWADFLVFPLVTRMVGLTFQPTKEYTIIKSQDAVVKNVNGLNYAIGYLTANLFPYVFKAEAPEEDMDVKMADSSPSWERIIMSVDFPFRFHVIACARDVQDARDELEGKRSYQEFQMNKMMQAHNTTEVEVSELRRKLNILQADIDRISEGERPISTIMYFESIAVGVTQKAACDTLTAQLNGLQVSLSTLDLQLVRVVGRDLHTVFDFNFMLPTTRDEMATYFDTQG